MARKAELDSALDVEKALSLMESASNLIPAQPEPPDSNKKNPDRISVHKTESGEYVWEVREETPEERMAKLDERYRRSIGLIDKSDPLFDNNAIQIDPNREDPVKLLEEKKGKFDPSVLALQELKGLFAEFDYGPKGLVLGNSDDAKKYKLCIEAVRSGKVVLPTVPEYQKQKREYAERRKKQMDNVTTNQNQLQAPVPTAPQPQVTPQLPPQPPAPQQATMQDRVDPNMVQRAQGFQIPANVMEAQRASEQAPTEQVTWGGNATQTPPPQSQQPTVTPQAPVPTAPQPQVTPQPERKPIDVVEMQEMLAQRKLAEQQAASQQPVQNPVNNPYMDQALAEQQAEQANVSFNVPEGRSMGFYQSLPEPEKQKVQQAQVINITEVKEREIPTATRVITTMDQYRRVVKRKVTGEYVEVPLPNSGYIATVRPATSFEMTTILPMNENEDVPLSTRYQFIYEHIVTTSIGPMGYNQFLANTAAQDADALLWGIYKASVVSEQTIRVICGNAACRYQHQVSFSPDSVVNTDALSNETKIQINTIIAARDIQGDAKIIHEQSPAVNAKSLKLSDDCFITLKYPDMQMSLEREPITETLVERYGTTVVLIALVTKEIQRLGIINADSDTPEWFRVTDPIMICEELISMSDDEIQILSTALQNMESFDSYSFRINGPITCPKCGHTDPYIDIDLTTLFFYRLNRLGMNV